MPTRSMVALGATALAGLAGIISSLDGDADLGALMGGPEMSGPEDRQRDVGLRMPGIRQHHPGQAR